MTAKKKKMLSVVGSVGHLSNQMFVCNSSRNIVSGTFQFSLVGVPRFQIFVAGKGDEAEHPHRTGFSTRGA